MSKDSFRFKFHNKQQAEQAYDTLQEIGYNAAKTDGNGLSIRIHNQDVESALEICQAHEGTMEEEGDSVNLGQIVSSYGPGDWIIPAHTVNEDWDEAYLTGQQDVTVRENEGHNVSSDEQPEEDVDGFSGSVKA